MSAAVVKKFKVQNGSHTPHSPDSEWSSSPEPPSPLGIIFALTTPIEDRAFCYFRSTFVIGNARSFRYLDAIHTYGDMDAHLSVSIRAVGLASLSKASHSPDLETQAMRSYASALKMINKAITSSDVATTDTTLSAVMLLDQFEKIIPPTERTIKAWTNHLNGATALMKMRGPKQFQTKAGLEMFIQMSSHILVSCMQHTIPLPQDYLTLRTYATNFLDTSDVSWRLSEVTVRYIGFRAAIKAGSLFDPDTIIATATEMDKEMAALMAEFPSEWLPQPVPLSKPSDLVFESHYDVYANYKLAEAFNMIRAGRIPLLDLIREQCQAASSYPGSFQAFAYLKRVHSVKASVEDIASDICASVPQLAGYPLLLEQDSSVSPAAADSTKCIKLQPGNEASAYSLLWPLFTVANSPACSESARVWISRHLCILGRLLESDYALELAGCLQRREERDVWGVYAVLGSICYSVNG
ncbi:hypothetical protein LSUE1_G004656 [Lachnellula suecica]|uniref:C6 transcription factor n=1 Tax=Lachnellula suecica TaxID=602035 RepID=A0A8T9C708_9HELO|nr:hypothetical protein LSUE1_G004656 [Lachnellula suecica]